MTSALLLLLVQGDDAARILAEMKEGIGARAVVERIDALFYVGSDGDRAGLERCKRTIATMRRGLARDFIRAEPKEPLKVYLFCGARSYERYCREVLKEEPTTPFGFYRSADRALVMNIETGTGTLAHELVHPLAAADFPGIPSWFNEGFASLYEQSTTREDGAIWGLVNWRLPNLQKGLEKVDLAALMKTTSAEFYGRDSGLNYAAARYLCLYLQERGLLPRFYREFRDGFERDRTGITQLEKVAGRRLAELQPDWKAWVGTLKFRE
jgi:hypothetical protein